MGGSRKIVALKQRLRRLPGHGRELGESLLRFRVSTQRWQRLASQPRQLQAVAPFQLAFHELQAARVLVAATAREQQSLIKMARRMRETQLKMAELGQGVDICQDCSLENTRGDGGTCCESFVGQWFTPADGLFRRLLGQRAPLRPRQITHHDCCGYLGEQGCALPEGHRPAICAYFFCPGLKQALEERGVWPEIQAQRVVLSELLSKFELTLSVQQQRRDQASQSLRGRFGLLGRLLDRQRRAHEAISLRQQQRDPPPRANPREG